MVRISNPNAPPTRLATILVVDDMATLRHIVSGTLGAMGFQTLVAADGQAAIDLITRCHPDAIVTDLEMPNMNGNELIEFIRTSDDPQIRNLPILVISSRSDEITRAKLRHLGADGFVAKPVDVVQLQSTASRLFVDL